MKVTIKEFKNTLINNDSYFLGSTLSDNIESIEKLFIKAKNFDHSKMKKRNVLKVSSNFITFDNNSRLDLGGKVYLENDYYIIDYQGFTIVYKIA